MKIDTKDFLEWARTKPKGERYSYVSSSQCPVAQFLKAQGLSWVSVGPRHWHGYKPSKRRWWSLLRQKGERVDGLVPIPVNNAALASDRTFGSLVKRLEAAA